MQLTHNIKKSCVRDERACFAILMIALCLKNEGFKGRVCESYENQNATETNDNGENPGGLRSGSDFGANF